MYAVFERFPVGMALLLYWFYFSAVKSNCHDSQLVLTALAIICAALLNQYTPLFENIIKQSGHWLHIQYINLDLFKPKGSILN